MTTRHQALCALKTLQKESYYKDKIMLNKLFTYLQRPASTAHFLGLKEGTVYNTNDTEYVIKNNELFIKTKDGNFERPLVFEALDFLKYNYEDYFMSNMYEIPDVDKLENLRQDAILELEILASLGIVDKSNDYLIKNIHDYLTNKASLKDHLGWAEGNVYYNITDDTLFKYKIKDDILYRQVKDDEYISLNINEELNTLLKTLELKKIS